MRNGKVASIYWMRAQIAGDLGAIAEQTKNMAEADQLYRSGVAMLEVNSRLGGAHQRKGAARRLSGAQWRPGRGRSDVPRARPFAGGYGQPPAVLRAHAAALCRYPAEA